MHQQRAYRGGRGRQLLDRLHLDALTEEAHFFGAIPSWQTQYDDAVGCRRQSR
jgi:hypothetical protein